MSNTIKIQRNRAFTAEIIIKANDNSVYTLESGETLIFGVKENPDNTSCLITKEITADDKADAGYTLTLSSDDTDIPIKAYYYDIALQRSDGELETIIDCTDFIISKSVVRG